MKPLFVSIMMFALTGCGQEPGHDQRRNLDRRAAESNVRPGAHTVDPETVPESYSAYPPEVRLQIYRWDLLNQKCRGHFRGSRDAACDGRHKLEQELLPKGWCYGGSDSPATRHWVLCAQDYPGGEDWIAGPIVNDLTPEG